MSKSKAFTKKDLLDKGFIESNGNFYAPAVALKLGITPTKPTRKKRTLKTHSDKTDSFCHFVKLNLNIDLVTEYRFDKLRKWRFDYANEELKLAIEQEGGVFSNGRHVRGKGYVADMEKYNQAALQGWTLIRRTPQQLQTEETLTLIKSMKQI